jgi:hypothetical protein
MNTAMENFTVSVVDFDGTVGDNIAATRPGVTLLIVPNPGYTASASQFSANEPLPEYVESVEFFQDGENIECVVTFVDPFIMPDNNVDMGLCLTGITNLITYGIGGIVYFDITNVTAPSGEGAEYGTTGEYNTVANVYSQSVIPSAGYYFPTVPTLTVTTGDASRYNITDTKNYDGANNLIGINFSVDYTFPNKTVYGDELLLTAVANEIYVPVIEITSYSMNTSFILEEGETREMKIFGNPGAEFSVIMNGTNLVTNIIMDSTGVYSLPITFPLVTANTVYTIEITGDLASPFLQTNPFIIEQKVATQITFDVLFNSGIANVTPVVKSYTAFGKPAVGTDAYNININWNITPTPALAGSQVLRLLSQPTISNWSNLNEATNGGSLITPTTVVSLQDPAVSGSITVSGNVSIYGRDDMTTTLDLTGLLTIVEPLAYSYTLTYFSQSGGGDLYGYNVSTEACDATVTTMTVYSNSSTITTGMELYSDEYGTSPLIAASYTTEYAYFKLNDKVITFEINDIESSQGYIVYSEASCPLPSFLYLGTSNQYATSGAACTNQVCATSYYLPIPAIYVGQVIYTDPELTTTYNGGNLWISISEACNGTYTAVQVDNSGNILSYTGC